MNEWYKLKEAEYFYERILEVQNTRDHFRYNLSAFLSASRSVLQYSFEETDVGKNPNAKPGGQKWYQDAVTKSQVISHYKDVRDINIHTSPINPRAHVGVTITERVGVGESVLVFISGKEHSATSQEQKAEVVRKEIPPEISYRYEFENWPGPEDVIQLCRMYLDELEDFIKEGIAKGFIMG